MNINEISTLKFYETFTPCECEYCQYFIKHIEEDQPLICNYLKLFNINPQKPYEIQSVELKKTIEYIDCVYLVFGSIKQDEKIIINNIVVSITKESIYPVERFNDKYFFVSFGPISMCYQNETDKDLTFEEKKLIIKRIIDEADPIGLLKLSCPGDEYLPEVTLIAGMVKKNRIYWRKIQKVFKSQFEEIIPRKICLKMANQINTQLKIKIN